MPARRFALRLFATLVILSPLTTFPAVAQAAPSEVKVDAATLNKYAGQYRYDDEPDITLSFFHDGNQLAVESTRIPHTPLHAFAQDTFATANGSTRYVFLNDSSGRVTASTASQAKKS